MKGLNTTDEVKDIRTTDAVEVGSVVEVETTDAAVENEELPKSWSEEDRNQYAVVKAYLESVETGEYAFEGVEHKVVLRAKRDAK